MADKPNITPRTETGIAAHSGMDGGLEENVRAYGSTVTDNSKHVDEYSFSVQDKLEHGIGDHESVVIANRNPRRIAQLRHKYGEARPAKNVKTGADPYDHMDCQAVIVPKAALEEQEARRKKAAQEYLGKFKPDTRGNFVLKEDLFETEERMVLQRRQLNSERFAAAGIGEGSETSGMSFEEGLAYLKRTGRDPERLGDLARQNGQHRADNRDQWRHGMGGTAPTFAVGANFAPQVTPKSALGQVQARNANRGK